MSTEHPTATRLERVEDAHMACRGAWLYPSDHEVREAAVVACALLGVNYLEAVAHVMDNPAATGDSARRQVAESWRKLSDSYVAAGDLPRTGINALGMDAA